MKLRILFLTNKVPFPPKDGGSIATFGMIKPFADAGHKVTVLAMNTRKHHVTPFEIPNDLQAQITFHLVEVPAHIKLIELLKNLLFSKLPYNAERFIDNKYTKKLESLLSAFEYDIIQLEGLYLYPYIPTIRKFSKAKIAYRSHNIEHEIWERSAIQAKGLKKFYLNILSSRLKQFELDSINTYDLLLPITERDNSKLREMGNKKPSFSIPAGFDIDSQIQKQTDFEMNIFFIGALDWLPNQEGIIWFIERCWPQILKQEPTVILKIAGRNAPSWLIDKLNVKNTQYLGEIDDAKEYIINNGIMIAPMLSGSGMRIKIIEGMLYQKAIITSTIGCEGIKVKNEEQLFIADTPADFSKYVLSLLRNRKKIIETGAKAFKFVKDEYNNQHLNNKLVAFYNQHIG
ncbi:MAG: glycosyltransferase family 4 protein [Prolixibacteraceae bacterium]|jgi:glycosyltransferase involved in cell wall biosynthesis|nr:glycosyltransferase family 4 protein [Prolixibacteraceae bacterium]